MGDDVRVAYTYIHANRKIKNHIEVIWKHEQKHYEIGVYGRLFRDIAPIKGVKANDKNRVHKL